MVNEVANEEESRDSESRQHHHTVHMLFATADEHKTGDE
ncbi:hypothetical protein RIEGSTA812A_PEG_196 [invertebrate metagenome]|uniref:Uncharacterized protein n=1 Tax=invertebrate metagenome TaxID=1711999 RepID=A0A484H7R8_9ZZZZ